ncbi:mechanosensitive ion channel family protein [Halomarina ordinaria]|uniref:Mechanosensitive ion channel family protein n=1 Tax=Halomarina ordinaria TaxID=3033939 RepID=A0ABD5U4U4_9EURY|nr:mechanosensitive ion channel family protein [Halomarina sp. PSRA2]
MAAQDGTNGSNASADGPADATNESANGTTGGGGATNESANESTWGPRIDGEAGATTPENNTAAETANALGEFLAQWLPVGLADAVSKFVLAVVIMVLAWYASKVINRLLGRRIARRFRRPSVSRTVLRLIRLVVMFFGFTTVLTVYEVQLGDIVLSVTVFTAVVGVILAPIVGSYISGIFVLADQPYEVGDMVEIVDQDVHGFVEDVTLRYTKIFTLDNTFVTIPNGSIRDRDVVNYSAEDPRTRLRLDVTVSYEDDVEAARRLLENAARDVDVVIDGGPDIRIGSARYPAAPTCYVNDFADHGVLLTLRFWVKEPYKLLTARSKILERVWDRQDDVDMTFPYPHSHLVFDETSGHLDVAVGEGGPGGRVADGDRRGTSDANPNGRGDARSDDPST